MCAAVINCHSSISYCLTSVRKRRVKKASSTVRSYYTIILYEGENPFYETSKKYAFEDAEEGFMAAVL